MNPVPLDRARNIDQVFVDHRNERRVVFGRKIAKHLVKCSDVILPVIRRKRYSGEQHLDVSTVQCCQHGVQILPRLIQWKAAQAVIAAEFYDHDRRVGFYDRPDIRGRVLCCRSTGTHIRHVVGVTALVKIPL